MIMQARIIKIVKQTLFLLVCCRLDVPVAFAASPTSPLLKAKQVAESKGYVFLTTHDEIVSNARKEGKLRVMAGVLDSVKPTTEAFKKRYPFIDVHVESIRGTQGQSQRNLLEIQSGASKNLDIARTYSDAYSEYLPHLWQVDLLGMAEYGVLRIPFKMIDPGNRNVMAILSQFQVTTYNKNFISPSHVPKTWEDILTPAFKGRKFAAEIRPLEIAALVPAWGLERTLDFARKLAAQEPIWTGGASRTLAAVGAGEVPLFLGANYGSTKRYQRKDPSGTVQITILEPVPVRIGSEQGILARSANPHAALLWLEFMASSEAQRLIDEYEPLASSFYVQGSAVEQELKGKKLSVVSWEENTSLGKWMEKIVEAYGFPRATTK